MCFTASYRQVDSFQTVIFRSMNLIPKFANINDSDLNYLKQCSFTPGSPATTAALQRTLFNERSSTTALQRRLSNDRPPRTALQGPPSNDRSRMTALLRPLSYDGSPITATPPPLSNLNKLKPSTREI